ncbi:acyl-CoA dehydrogenase [Thermosyntropha lipolytica DSM 11003]|uniref:Acyl-CoA dehydrogenase n=1 Tax=Thermosyntropha lipolytica DSM 11003 TaxID=1123382 RepID=A0A1M5N9F7_9FIRM|nr:acyl-CoA dehydrogenase family protein [Thermosyntropha lipolytica]SHG85643.1 acyl-CoA dehydrogenase [Thermosyntropha lipolytica DSM 11003]
MASFVLNREEIELINEVHELAVKKIAPRAFQLDAIGDDIQDWAIPEMLAEKNLLAPLIPKEYGGRGLSMVATAAVIEELAYGCAGAAAMVVQNIYAITPLLIAGSERQKEEFLPLLTGKKPKLAAIAINEARPDYNLERPEKQHEELTRISSTFAYEGDSVIIEGSKDYIINGAEASFILLLARDEDSRHKSSLQFFVLPGDSEGIEIKEVLHKMGLRTCHTVKLGFNKVKIPAAYAVGRRGSGYLLLLQTFDLNRTLLGAMGVGIAKAAYNLALKVARNNSLLGTSSPSKYYVSSTLADMSTQIDAARLSVMRAAYCIDADENYARVSGMARLYATQVAQQVTSTAVDVIGRLGFLIGHPAEKYLRDAQMLSMIAGSDYLHKKVLSAQL